MVLTQTSICLACNVSLASKGNIEEFCVKAINIIYYLHGIVILHFLMVRLFPNRQI